MRSFNLWLLKRRLHRETWAAGSSTLRHQSSEGPSVGAEPGQSGERVSRRGGASYHSECGTGAVLLSTQLFRTPSCVRLPGACDEGQVEGARQRATDTEEVHILSCSVMHTARFGVQLFIKHTPEVAHLFQTSRAYNLPVVEAGIFLVTSYYFTANTNASL